MTKSARSLVPALLLILGLVSLANAKQWTDRQGRTIIADYSRLDGDEVVLQQGLKVLKVPLSSLSDADQEFVRKRNAPKGGDDPTKPGPVESPKGPLTGDRLWKISSKPDPIRGKFKEMMGPDKVLVIATAPGTFGSYIWQVSELSEADRKFLERHGQLKALLANPAGNPPAGPPTAERMWASKKLPAPISGKFVRLVGTTSVLISASGGSVTIQIADLGDADIQFLKAHNLLAPPPRDPSEELYEERVWTLHGGKQLKGTLNNISPFGEDLSLKVDGELVFLEVEVLSKADRELLIRHGKIKTVDSSGAPLKPKDYPRIPRDNSIDAPRWWHTPKMVGFAGIHQIGTQHVALQYGLNVVHGNSKYDEMSPKESEYVIKTARAKGQDELADYIQKRVGDRNSKRLDAVPGDNLTDADYYARERRLWYDGYKAIYGKLLEVENNSYQVELDDGNNKHLFVDSLCEQDMNYLQAFLKKHGATEIAEESLKRWTENKYRSETKVVGQMRSWDVRGMPQQAKLVHFGSDGLELRDATNQTIRMTYKELSVADIDYLDGFTKSPPSISMDEIRFRFGRPAAYVSTTPPSDDTPRRTITVQGPTGPRQVEVNENMLPSNPAYSFGQGCGVLFIIVFIIAVVRQVMMQSK